MEEIKLSVITPSFNQGKYIKKCIDSVLSQNYSNMEHIIIDGGSTDNTISILKSYGDKIKWISESDKGQTDAINKGLKMASGEILCFLCTDDMYFPGAIKKVINFFKIHSEVDLVTGDYKIIDQDNKEMQSFIVIYKKFLRLFASFNLLSIVNYVVEPSTFWRRSVYLKIGDFDQNLSYTMDYDYWMKSYINNLNFGFINEPLSFFRIHKNSKGGSKFIDQFKEELLVQRRYNKNIFINLIHKIHVFFIVSIYKLIKC